MLIVGGTPGAVDEQAGVVAGARQSDAGRQEHIDPPKVAPAFDAAAGAAGKANFVLVRDIGRRAILTQERPIEREVVAFSRL